MIEIDFVLPFSLLRNQRVDRQFLFSAGGLDVGKKCIQPIELIQAEKLRTAATDRRARSRSGTTAFIQLGIKQAKFEFSGHDRFESAPVEPVQDTLQDSARVARKWFAFRREHLHEELAGRTPAPWQRSQAPWHRVTVVITIARVRYQARGFHIL